MKLLVQRTTWVPAEERERKKEYYDDDNGYSNNKHIMLPIPVTQLRIQALHLIVMVIIKSHHISEIQTQYSVPSSA